MTLAEARAKIIEAVQAHFQAAGVGLLKHVGGHPGRFTEEDLKAFALKLPAVLVTCAGVSNISRQRDAAHGAVHWVATVIAQDLPGKDRDVVALDVAGRLASLVNRDGAAKWGDPQGASDFEGGPLEIAAANLYSGKAQTGAGVTLWAVSWKQRQKIEELTLSGLVDLLKVHAEYDTNGDGAPEATDDITLEGAT